jgi:hypothetical protein
MRQKDAVFETVTSVTGFNGGKLEMSKDQRDRVVDILVGKFNDGQVELSSPQADIKKYVIGLVNNWVRKDPRFNDGAKYETKNPGSRSGLSDPVVKNLRALMRLSTTSDQDRVLIQAEIDKRVTSAKKTKETTIAVNAELIPDEFKHMIK